MREIFPTVARGDHLTAAHVNALSNAARHSVGGYGGHYQNSGVGVPPHVQWVVEISRIVNVDKGLYGCYPRYAFSQGDRIAWRTDDDGDHPLDISSTWKDKTTATILDPYQPPAAPRAATKLEVGDRLFAWYHVNRETFVADPTGPAGVGFIEFTLMENMQERHATARIDFWWGRDPVEDAESSSGSTGSSPEQLVVYDTTDNFRRALKGAKGVAVWDTWRRIYIVIICQSKAGTIQGTLKTGLGTASGSGGGTTSSGGTSMGSTPGSGTAGSGASTTINGEVEITSYYGTQGDIQDPQGHLDSEEGRPKIQVYDPLGLFKRAMTGAKFKAILDAIADRYNLVECQTKAGFIAFRTDVEKRSRTGGDCGTLADSWEVAVTRYWGTQQDVQNPCPNGEQIQVYDFEGQWPWPVMDCEGLAALDVENDRYNVIACQQRAFLGSGTIPYDFAEGQTYFNANLSPNTPSPFNGAIGYVDVYNVHGWSAIAGSAFDAKWNESQCRWEMVQITTDCQ